MTTPRISLIPGTSSSPKRPFIVAQGPVTSYVPSARMVVLRLDASPYERFHELAHAQQHQERAACFVLWRLTRWIPWVRNSMRLLVEEDAASRALAAMHFAGCWTPDTGQEAQRGLDTYARKLLLP